MRAMIALGVIAIVLGVLLMAYQGINVVTEEKVVDIGPVEGSVEQERWIPFPPLVGVGLLVLGGILLIGGYSRSPS